MSIFDWSSFTFKHPQFFWLLLLVPLMAAYYWKVKRFTRPVVKISSTDAFRNYPKSWKQRLVNLPLIFRFVTITFLIVALARPQSTSSSSNVTTEGISIVVALDISTSMLAEDFRPNRIWLYALAQNRNPNPKVLI